MLLFFRLTASTYFVSRRKGHLLFYYVCAGSSLHGEKKRGNIFRQVADRLCAACTYFSHPHLFLPPPPTYPTTLPHTPPACLPVETTVVCEHSLGSWPPCWHACHPACGHGGWFASWPVASSPFPLLLLPHHLCCMVFSLN